MKFKIPQVESVLNQNRLENNATYSLTCIKKKKSKELVLKARSESSGVRTFDLNKGDVSIVPITKKAPSDCTANYIYSNIEFFNDVVKEETIYEDDRSLVMVLDKDVRVKVKMIPTSKRIKPYFMLCLENMLIYKDFILNKKELQAIKIDDVLPSFIVAEHLNSIKKIFKRTNKSVSFELS